MTTLKLKFKLFYVIASLGILLSLTSCASISDLTGVTLDVSKVEKNIEEEIYNQTYTRVTAECPNPMVGKVGETRTCVIKDGFGDTNLVDVTIQNSNGDIVWEVRR